MLLIHGCCADAALGPLDAGRRKRNSSSRPVDGGSSSEEEMDVYGRNAARQLADWQQLKRSSQGSSGSSSSDEDRQWKSKKKAGGWGTAVVTLCHGGGAWHYLVNKRMPLCLSQRRFCSGPRMKKVSHCDTACADTVPSTQHTGAAKGRKERRNSSSSSSSSDGSWFTTLAARRLASSTGGAAKVAVQTAAQRYSRAKDMASADGAALGAGRAAQVGGLWCALDFSLHTNCWLPDPV
jgi:hypothetical protein